MGRDLPAALSELHSNRAWYGYDSGPLGQARTAAMEALTTAQLIGDGLLQLSALETLVLIDFADLVHHPGGVHPDARGQHGRTGLEDLALTDPPAGGVDTRRLSLTSPRKRPWCSSGTRIFRREARLTRAVTGQVRHDPLIPALRREVHALVHHCTDGSAAPI
ncbi:hypothetical protein Shyhy02_79130 [Streptomyces hygroscopicus subsp. hygroscopicus]|nr:hypothetical protein Shyhy02_79130 [Streptomyces hygroscopicus subsp. hygroscopicus]